MENKKNFKILGGVVLTLVLVAILSITYATYTQTLKITGQGKVEKQNWSIIFKDLSVEHTGESKVNGNAVIDSGNSTSISGIDFTLVKPGDTVTYKFKVVNEGTFDAKLVGTTMPALVCKSELDDSTDQGDFCSKHILVELKKSDGNAYDVNSILNRMSDESQTEESLELKFTYLSDTPYTDLPTNDISIKQFEFSLQYQQYNKN